MGGSKKRKNLQFRDQSLAPKTSIARVQKKSFSEKNRKKQYRKHQPITSKTTRASREVSDEVLAEIKDLHGKIRILQFILCICLTVGPALTYVAWGLIPAVIVLIITAPAIAYYFHLALRKRKLLKSG